jgi:uncharacterized protein
MMLLSAVTFLLHWICLPIMQFWMDLPQQVSFSGGGVYNGRGGVADFFKALGESLEPQQFEPRDFIAQGNKVVVLGYQRGQAKPTGRPYEIEFVHLWSVRDGKFSEFRVFNDTAALVEPLYR